MLMHNCLADASPEFVTFCIAQLQLMAALGIGKPGEDRYVQTREEGVLTQT